MEPLTCPADSAINYTPASAPKQGEACESIALLLEPTRPSTTDTGRDFRSRSCPENASFDRGYAPMNFRRRHLTGFDAWTMRPNQSGPIRLLKLNVAENALIMI
ncbi:hypothetical protein [Paraburkholderia youngii]|uniref:Uncharacterized protein n=1 Tax=Paraburkholderia youngii TaxID=2782701 RepID=A0ABX2NW24_9BURK|nr:hypothetical protein [Paraburkholderia youngii]NVI08708.1 hypothetical protein [Paraburkholderia youngii]